MHGIFALIKMRKLGEIQLIKGVLKYVQLILKEKNNACKFMIAWSYMKYEELVLKNVLLAQQKRRKNAVIINSTKQITILNKVKKIALTCTFTKL